jgi:hypothetical protein
MRVIFYPYFKGSIQNVKTTQEAVSALGPFQPILVNLMWFVNIFWGSVNTPKKLGPLRRAPEVRRSWEVVWIWFAWIPRSGSHFLGNVNTKLPKFACHYSHTTLLQHRLPCNKPKCATKRNKIMMCMFVGKKCCFGILINNCQGCIDIPNICRIFS